MAAARRDLCMSGLASAAIVASAVGRRRPTYGSWPWAAAAAAAPATALAVANRGRAASPAAAAMWASLPLLLWHQTEEWILPGGFLPWFNRTVWNSERDDYPVTPKIGFMVNVVAGWGVSLAAALSAERVPSLAGAVLISHLGNGTLHIREAAVSHSYNPGLASALALAPLGAAGTVATLADTDVPKRQSLAGIALGAIVSGVFVGSLRRRARRSPRERVQQA
jgi:Protein of unknown function with HXXEE motif